MNYGTAASIGLGLLQHRQEIGAALKGLTGGLGQMSGQGFTKIAEQFHLPKGITNQISTALENNRDPNQMNAVHVLSSMRYFDADQNGKITQSELTKGLQQLQDAGLSQTGDSAKLYSMGSMMLKHYQQAAQLDGNANGISYRDVGKLLSQDGNIGTLAPTDWQKLTT